MYEKLNHLMTEVRELNKLQSKIISQDCCGMTPDQVELLFLIDEKKMNQKELAKTLRITEATLSVRIKRLVESELIEREIDSHDKRNFTIILSVNGEKIIDDMKKTFIRYQQIISKGITDEDYKAVLSFIKKIQENIKEELKEC